MLVSPQQKVSFAAQTQFDLTNNATLEKYMDLKGMDSAQKEALGNKLVKAEDDLQMLVGGSRSLPEGDKVEFGIKGSPNNPFISVKYTDNDSYAMPLSLSSEQAGEITLPLDTVNITSRDVVAQTLLDVALTLKRNISGALNFLRSAKQPPADELPIVSTLRDQTNDIMEPGC